MKKIAVITGASSGMGREMAFQLADRFGVLEEIWLVARRKERLEELRDQFPAAVLPWILPMRQNGSSWRWLSQKKNRM